MKRRMTLSLALALSVISLALASFDSTARAQQRRVFRADTGMIMIGPNQVLRLTVVSGDFNPDNDISVRFRRMGYVEADNVYKVAAQNVTGPVRLMPGEAASLDITRLFLGGVYADAVRGVVESNRPGARVTVQIIDETTGETQIIVILIAT